MNAEVNQLVEKRMMSGDPTDDKVSLFRQQVGQSTPLFRQQVGQSYNSIMHNAQFHKTAS